MQKIVLRQVVQKPFLIGLTLSVTMVLAQNRQPPFFDETFPIPPEPPSTHLPQDHQGNGPLWQGQASDIKFITDKGATLDTHCRFRNEGDITIEILINRVVGEVDENGQLKYTQKLIKQGQLSQTASLEIPIYDVDLPKEIDEVWFNDIKLGNLMGGDGIWELNRFEIPIEQVKFPQYNPLGIPQPAINTLVIKIDTISTIPTWCTSVDWASLSFKAMSPIVLLQSSPAEANLFYRRGFTKILQQKHLLFDIINMATARIGDNAMTLNEHLPQIVNSFGVDSIHLIAYSKGGLDSREYLANYQYQHNEHFQVLSYTSLGTPHNGSVLADIVMHRAITGADNNTANFQNFSPFLDTVTKTTGINAEIADLTTSSLALFNWMNLSRLPTNLVVNTVAADADSNRNNQIDRNDPDEYAELRAENQVLANIDNQTELGVEKSRIIVDVPYQILRHTAHAQIKPQRQSIVDTQSKHSTTYISATLSRIPSSIPLANDTFVTVPSAQGQDTLALYTTNEAHFTADQGKNQASILNTNVAKTVLPWLIEVEKNYGDLK